MKKLIDNLLLTFIATSNNTRFTDSARTILARKVSIKTRKNRRNSSSFYLATAQVKGPNCNPDYVITLYSSFFKKELSEQISILKHEISHLIAVTVGISENMPERSYHGHGPLFKAVACSLGLDKDAAKAVTKAEAKPSEVKEANSAAIAREFFSRVAAQLQKGK